MGTVLWIHKQVGTEVKWQHLETLKQPDNLILCLLNLLRDCILSVLKFFILLLIDSYCIEVLICDWIEAKN